jgi:hypothetical protein
VFLSKLAFMTATAFAALLPASVPAQAAQAAADSSCSWSYHVCIWKKAGFSGTRWRYNHSQSDLGTAANREGSLAIHGPTVIRLYFGDDYKGAWACFDGFNGPWIRNLGNFTFNKGKGKPGYGDSVYHNAASMSINVQESQCSS